MLILTYYRCQHCGYEHEHPEADPPFTECPRCLKPYEDEAVYPTTPLGSDV